MYHRTRQGAVDVICGPINSRAPLNHEQIEQLEQLLEECLLAGQPLAVMDLSQTSLIDSAALELLLDAGEEFARRGGTLKLAGANSLCHDILRACGISSRFEMFPHASAAVGSFLR